MLELGQFDLQLAFSRAGALGENIEDERGAIENLAIEHLLQVAALGWRKLIVENHRINVRAPAVLSELIGLALADERAGARRRHLLYPIADHFSPGGVGQFREFRQRIAQFPAVPGFQFHSHQKNSFSSSVPVLDQCFQFYVVNALVALYHILRIRKALSYRVHAAITGSNCISYSRK